MNATDVQDDEMPATVKLEIQLRPALTGDEVRKCIAVARARGTNFNGLVVDLLRSTSEGSKVTSVNGSLLPLTKTA
jgi:hypothetical protein